MNRWLLFVAVTILFGCAYARFERVLIDAQPLDEVTVTETKRPEWPTHYFLCKRLYAEVTQHGKFMNCIRADMEIRGLAHVE